MKKFIAVIMVFLGGLTQVAEAEGPFPPVPKWRPDFAVSVDVVLERMKYYTNKSRDIAVFKNGTAVVLQDGMDDAEAKKYALNVLSQIYNNHPDMKPFAMNDGNILIQYNLPVYNVVVNEFAVKHMKEIKKHHLDGLATSEVLITPLGNNVFDEFGMKVLYGRTFMFMDAQAPEIVKIYRHK